MPIGLHVTKSHSDDCRYQNKPSPWRPRSLVKRNAPNKTFGYKVDLLILQCMDPECYAEGTVIFSDLLRGLREVTKNDQQQNPK